MRSLVASIALVCAAQLAAPPPSQAGSPGPAPREVLVHDCASGDGTCTTSDNEASCSDSSNPCTCDISATPCPPINVVAEPITADLTLSATDNPACDNDPFAACGGTIDACTTNAGSMSTLSVAISGRFKRGDGLRGRGGRPFSVSLTSGICDLGIHACSSTDPTTVLCTNNGERLTESLLATTFGRDIAWQPLPASLASALASTLRITTGTPYVSNVLARTVDHDGTADASATVVRFSVQIEFVQ